MFAELHTVGIEWMFYIATVYAAKCYFIKWGAVFTETLFGGKSTLYSYRWNFGVERQKKKSQRDEN